MGVAEVANQKEAIAKVMKMNEILSKQLNDKNVEIAQQKEIGLMELKQAQTAHGEKYEHFEGLNKDLTDRAMENEYAMKRLRAQLNAKNEDITKLHQQNCELVQRLSDQSLKAKLKDVRIEELNEEIEQVLGERDRFRRESKTLRASISRIS